MKTHTLVLAVLLLGASAAASADPGDRDGGMGAGTYHERLHRHGPPSLQAPELDSTLIIAGLTLLGGALLVLRGRRI